MENVRKEHMTTFHKRLPVCDPTLDPKFSNKYKFTTTWILTQKWWLKNYSYSFLCKWTMSRRFLGSRNGTSPQFSRKLRNFPRSSCWIPFLKNGFTRQHFGFNYPACSSWLYIDILFTLFHWAFLLMALHLCSHCSWKWQPKNFLITQSRTLVCLSSRISRFKVLRSS